MSVSQHTLANTLPSEPASNRLAVSTMPAALAPLSMPDHELCPPLSERISGAVGWVRSLFRGDVPSGLRAPARLPKR
ncbi:hypothetical protein JM93_04089 [Roseibium hamelinense]|uniref:Uncharacterized protein n=1 Tax=Roseibium hamelinense TaxID=150831 RepID=A0A562SF37_9HYPH|nr:hypothetical protein [Roseibium hamelinense]MTI44238.1 hypothetical protein [Roseibium hamelinense]TWI79977.1 hypothetical protein JM93_04089 [Roseibium hamelinense]